MHPADSNYLMASHRHFTILANMPRARLLLVFFHQWQPVEALPVRILLLQAKPYYG